VINPSIATVAAVLVAALHGGAAGAQEWTGVRVCLQEQIECGAGQCEPARLEAACNFSALDPEAAAVVRAEMRSFARMLQETPSAPACAADVASRVEQAASSIRDDGPLQLDAPHALTPAAVQGLSSVETELYWRAQLEERASGFARQRYIARQNGQEDDCGLPALVDVVQLRSQNLAFAESVGALEMARNGELAPPAAWGVWFIYNHADLWQAEQAEAAAVFTQLAADDAFPDTLARGLARRVAGHQPLYSPDQLQGGWPD
jgi:hypothetical protein